MADIRDAEPVKLIVAMLSAFSDVFPEVDRRLTEQWGRIDLESPTMPHTFTDYYRAEMGEPLVRRFVSFEELIDPARLAEIKRGTNELEREFAATGRHGVPRPINLDPGYVTPAKLVLASCKDYTHRVYLGGGVYAEPTLGYSGGRWTAYEWTYPDYRTVEYHGSLSKVRERLMAQRKEARRA